jgi:hypothetical protein
MKAIEELKKDINTAAQFVEVVEVVAVLIIVVVAYLALSL